jgi:hypothetical protein
MALERFRQGGDEIWNPLVEHLSSVECIVLYDTCKTFRNVFGRRPKIWSRFRTLAEQTGVRCLCDLAPRCTLRGAAVGLESAQDTYFTRCKRCETPGIVAGLPLQPHEGDGEETEGRLRIGVKLAATFRTTPSRVPYLVRFEHLEDGCWPDILLMSPLPSAHQATVRLLRRRQCALRRLYRNLHIAIHAVIEHREARQRLQEPSLWFEQGPAYDVWKMSMMCLSALVIMLAIAQDSPSLSVGMVARFASIPLSTLGLVEMLRRTWETATSVRSDFAEYYESWIAQVGLRSCHTRTRWTAGISRWLFNRGVHLSWWFLLAGLLHAQITNTCTLYNLGLPPLLVLAFLWWFARYKSGQFPAREREIGWNFILPALTERAHWVLMPAVSLFLYSLRHHGLDLGMTAITAPVALGMEVFGARGGLSEPPWLMMAVYWVASASWHVPALPGLCSVILHLLDWYSIVLLRFDVDPEPQWVRSVWRVCMLLVHTLFFMGAEKEPAVTSRTHLIALGVNHLLEHWRRWLRRPGL